MSERMSCERCGKPANIIALGDSAPAVCEACALYERREQEARTQAGSPYETAAKLDVPMQEEWHD